MLIKLTKIYDGKIANKYAAKFVEGTKLENGEVWSKAYFANQKDLTDKLMNFSIGDEVNVVLQENGDKKYKIVDFKEVTDEDRAKIAKYANKSTQQPAANAANTTYRRSDGGSRGDDTNRSAAIYLARDIVMQTKKDTVLHKSNPASLLEEIVEVAELIKDYIKDGLIPPPSNGTMPDDDGDALDPPEA